MSETPTTNVEPTPLAEAVADAFAADQALLALGIPSCPSCELLTVTLSLIDASRPDLVVRLAAMASQEDWDARETLLWPRDIRVSRASIPVLVLVRGGRVVASRHGGGPAAALDAWLTEHLGPPARELPAGISDLERAALSDLGQVRANLLAARAARSGLG